MSRLNETSNRRENQTTGRVPAVIAPLQPVAHSFPQIWSTKMAAIREVMWPLGKDMFLSPTSNQSWQRRHTENMCHFWVWDFKCLGCEILLWFSLSLQDKMQSASYRSIAAQVTTLFMGREGPISPHLGWGSEKTDRDQLLVFFFKWSITEVLL